MQVTRYSSEEFKKNHYYSYDRASGRVECINYETGQVVAYAHGPNAPMVSVEGPELIVRTPAIYTDHLADTICELLASGESITSICKMKGFPSYAQLARWRSHYAAFGEAFDKARAMRAEIMHDRILDELDDSLSPEDVSVAKLKFDKLKYLASVNDPDRFGNRVKHSGDKDQPLQFVIDTGIRRVDESVTGEGIGGSGISSVGGDREGDDVGDSPGEGGGVGVGDIGPTGGEQGSDSDAF
jgi:hypothetical protein